jgi:pyrroloquinoline-quinone synthase
MIPGTPLPLAGDMGRPLTEKLLTPEGLEAALRAIGAERYHNRHPFHKLLHGGKLERGQVQAWALNRYYYQRQIPIKDASLMARLDSADLRRAWRSRLIDHDGDGSAPGGIERWLKLAEGVGLDRAYVESTAGILPTTRFAVDAYVHFVRDRSVLEAIASSLTELFSPNIIAERVEGMLRGYPFITMDTLAYFKPRLTQAPRDADFALAYVKTEARTVEQQQAVLAALRFKCDVLWSQLDGLYLAYVEPRLVPPGAFVPGRDGRPR